MGAFTTICGHFTTIRGEQHRGASRGERGVFGKPHMVESRKQTQHQVGDLSGKALSFTTPLGTGRRFEQPAQAGRHCHIMIHKHIQ